MGGLQEERSNPSPPGSALQHIKSSWQLCAIDTCGCVSAIRGATCVPFVPTLKHHLKSIAGGKAAQAASGSEETENVGEMK